MSFLAFQNLTNPSFNVSTSAGYLFSKRFAVGLNLVYSFIDGTLHELNYPTERSNVFSINPTSRFYFGIKKVSPFAEIGYELQLSKHVGINTLNYHRQLYRGGIGLNYFLNSSVAIESILSYAHIVNDPYTGGSSSGFGLKFGVQFFLSRYQKGELNESNGVYINNKKWMLGGTIDLNSSLAENSIPSFNPEVGYLFKNNLALGLRLSYQKMARVQCSTINPFARYYFSSKRLAPFLDASLGWGWGHSDVPYEEWDGNVTAMQVGAGINYFINEVVAFEGKLSYGVNTGFEEDLLTMDIGLKFFLSSKKK